MSTYLPDIDVSVTVELVDSDGNPLDATSVDYRVLDEDDAVVVASGAVPGFVAGATEVTVEVPAVSNALPAGALRSMRVVEFTVVSDETTTLLRSMYTIEAPVTVVEGTNSFQTYQRAVMTSFELPNLNGWATASESDRKVAMVSAWRKLLQYPYVVTIDEETFVEMWSQLEEPMIDAFRRAQVLQADYELGTDEVSEMRKAGLIASTVGESKQFMRSTKPLDTLICKRALREMTPFLLRTSAMLGRA